MLLSVLERIVIMGVIPQESNYLNYKILIALRTDLSFSEKEIKDYKLVENPMTKTVTWDNKKEKKKDVTIGEKAMDIVVESLKKLDREGKITSHNASIYERFVLPLKKE